MGLLNNKVYLENDYNNWVSMYEKEKQILQELLGNKVTIEHVGSTSVKDLKAKPIIDIAVGVNNIKDIDITKLKELYTIPL